MDQTYEGWKNYETWLTALWMDNDEPSQKRWIALTQETLKKSVACEYLTLEQAQRHNTEDAIKEALEGDSEDFTPSLAGDLYRAALSRVDYKEIAEHFIQKVKELETFKNA